MLVILAAIATTSGWAVERFRAGESNYVQVALMISSLGVMFNLGFIFGHKYQRNSVPTPAGLAFRETAIPYAALTAVQVGALLLLGRGGPRSTGQSVVILFLPIVLFGLARAARNLTGGPN